MIVRMRALVSVMAVAASIAACGSSPPATPTATSAEIRPTPSPTIKDNPSAKVSNVRYGGLTDAQVEQLRQECKGSFGVPGTDDKCKLPAQIPRCTSHFRRCILLAAVASRGVGVIQVFDQESGQPVCSDDAAICGVIVVRKEVTNRIKVVQPSTVDSLTTTTTTTTPTTPTTPTTTTTTPTTTATTKSRSVTTKATSQSGSPALSLGLQPPAGILR